MARTEYTIAPPKRIIALDLKELIRYRDLFWVLAWRDFTVRYKQTALGFLWAIFRPLVSMVIFTFVFSRGLKIAGDPRTPYAVFVFVGQLFWIFFSETLTTSSNSMVNNAAMIQKIYFPRLIVPATTTLTGLVDFVVSAVVLAGLMLYFRMTPAFHSITLVIPLLLMAALTTLGAGMFLSALNIKYRDVRHALPFITQMMMFVTPVIYPVTIFNRYPAIKEVMIWLNPMTGIITNARAAILGRSPFDMHSFLAAAIMSVVYFVFGLYYFRQTERYFADII